MSSQREKYKAITVCGLTFEPVVNVHGELNFRQLIKFDAQARINIKIAEHPYRTPDTWRGVYWRGVCSGTKYSHGIFHQVFVGPTSESVIAQCIHFAQSHGLLTDLASERFFADIEWL
jgi:hypothetical protein